MFREPDQRAEHKDRKNDRVKGFPPVEEIKTPDRISEDVESSCHGPGV